MPKPIDVMLDAVEWKFLGDPENTNEIYATHEGILNIGEFQFKVFQLSNGMRVIDEKDLIEFFKVK